MSSCGVRKMQRRRQAQGGLDLPKWLLVSTSELCIFQGLMQCLPFFSKSLLLNLTTIKLCNCNGSKLLKIPEGDNFL